MDFLLDFLHLLGFLHDSEKDFIKTLQNILIRGEDM